MATAMISACCINCIRLSRNNSLNIAKITRRNVQNATRYSTSYKYSSLVSSSNHEKAHQLAHHRSESTQPSIRNALDPFSLAEPELSSICSNIRQELSSARPEISEIVKYHFDGSGKSFRPMIILLTAKALNFHNTLSLGPILPSQIKVAEIAEMIHVASLVHDDIIDASNTRRGKPSVHHKWGQSKAVSAGDYILSIASQALARIGNPDVIVVLAQVIEDLVRGEFMQLGSCENEDERFAHYLKKTYKKTASLIANSCKAVAILGGCSERHTDLAYQYGRNLGMAFQLVDDMLDYTSSAETMGKPSAADLKLGLATAPVLFATQKFPELRAMIMRRFKVEGDIEKAWKWVTESDGIEQTKLLASRHCQEAVRLVKTLNYSNEQSGLVQVTNLVLNRHK